MLIQLRLIFKNLFSYFRTCALILVQARSTAMESEDISLSESIGNFLCKCSAIQPFKENLLLMNFDLKLYLNV